MNNITKYFEGEKIQCTIGIVASAICIGIAIAFLFFQKPLLRGISFSVLPLTALLLLICIGIVVRTPKDVARVTHYYQQEPQKMRSEELPRMEKVMRTFTIIKLAEMWIAVAGLLLVVVFRKNDLVLGIAIGVIILSSVFYLFDHIAEARGKQYVEFLNGTYRN